MQAQPTSILTAHSQEHPQNPTPTIVINLEHDPLPVQPSPAPLTEQAPAAQQTSLEALAEQPLVIAEQPLTSNLTPSIIPQPNESQLATPRAGDKRPASDQSPPTDQVRQPKRHDNHSRTSSPSPTPLDTLELFNV
jgi:hypothetical protein